MTTTEPMTKERLAKLKREHESLEHEVATLRKYIDDMERKAEAAKARLIALRGGYFCDGLLFLKAEQIKRAEADLRHQAMPAAVWVEEPRISSDWRIQKVTPKRVYLLRSGSGRATYYSREDGMVDRAHFREDGGKLDVAACLAALEAANGNA